MVAPLSDPAKLTRDDRYNIPPVDKRGAAAPVPGDAAAVVEVAADEPGPSLSIRKSKAEPSGAASPPAPGSRAESPPFRNENELS